ncbi:MAG: glycosyltransferase family 4 protein [Acidimicrobiaceae bacterium]|nr:glycosyltransferase family 4 protein [Acidimicrobiaceae bacterium]
MEIHQFVPSFAPRDAIGQHALALRDLLRELGANSEIFADEIKPGLESQARPYSRFHPMPSKNRWLIYQGSTLSPMAHKLSERREPLIINYHNITPPHLVQSWDFGASVATSIALDQMGKLSTVARGAIAVSRYNARDLVELGFKDPVVASPFIPHQNVSPRLDKDTPRGALWLFVGRIFPNKAQHDLIAALAAYKRIFDKDAKLILIGKRTSERYALALESYAEKLMVSDSVLQSGSVTDDELAGYYHEADLFVTTSEHEGFCFPIVEAMRHRLPILAYASSAIPETVGDGGVLLKDKSPVEFASAAWLLLNDSQLRGDCYAGAEEQLRKYSYQSAKMQNLSALASFIPPLQKEL